ncbi:hypothetical protein E6W39_02100 [Kitasatospora acidiphila]|uniref:Uncharacterized protein n=1 Tax=Kitasatospora acidiphila TaxID=2567942 RepID=A0A540VX10_9ACTN|nr:hypothetical protein [Kitasatospora acidiphila]TQF01247.1 hypothetical protein E6W39_02100 [Kitasatospora acidiphila]
MSGSYYVRPTERHGARREFTTADLIRTANALRPDASVSGSPSGADATIEIQIRGQLRYHRILYFADRPVFVLPEQDELEVPAAMVLQLLQRLAPDVETIWFADFDGVVRSLQVSGGVDDFVDALLSDQYSRPRAAAAVPEPDRGLSRPVPADRRTGGTCGPNYGESGRPSPRQHAR